MTRRLPAVRATSSSGAPTEFRTEAEFQRHVVGLARDAGWGISAGADKARDAELVAYGQPPAELDGIVFHPRLMLGSETGWPDLTLIRRRDRRLIFAELKTAAGKLSPRQVKVLALLRCLESEVRVLHIRPGEGVAVAAVVAAIREQQAPVRIGVYVWRPADLPAIEEVLR